MINTKASGEGYYTPLLQERYMIAIAEEKNITKAANRMFISQSAMSQQLLKVEKDLGVALFEREGKNLQITKAGEIYINAAKAILNIEKAFYEEIETQKKKHRSVTVAVCMAVPECVIEKMMEEICKSFTALEMNIINTEAINPEELNELLCSGRADVVIGPEQWEEQPEFYVLGDMTKRFQFIFGKNKREEGEELALLFPAESYLRQKENEALRKAGIKMKIMGTTSLYPEIMVKTGNVGAFLEEGSVIDIPEERKTQAFYTMRYTARMLRFGHMSEIVNTQ